MIRAEYNDAILHLQVSAEALQDRIQSLGDDKDKIIAFFEQEKAKMRSLKKVISQSRYLR